MKDATQSNSISWRRRRNIYRAATLLWGTILLIASLQPMRPGNFHFSPLHPIAHFLGFGALALLATLGFGNPGRFSYWPALATVLLGFSIEFLQHAQSRMPIEWNDVRDDAAGILVFTVLCYTRIGELLGRPKPSSKDRDLVSRS